MTLVSFLRQCHPGIQTSYALEGDHTLATTALLSDIHGNEEALKVVLAAIDDLAVDQIICLGDSVDYGPRSQQVLSMLRERNIPSIKGNHDDAST